MEATVRRGLKMANKVYQPGEMVEAPMESLWSLALQGYVDLPEDFKSKLDDDSKKELERVQKATPQGTMPTPEPTPAPSGGTPRLPGDPVIPPPPPKLADQGQGQPGQQQPQGQPPRPQQTQPQPQQSSPPPEPPQRPEQTHEQEAKRRR